MADLTAAAIGEVLAGDGLDTALAGRIAPEPPKKRRAGWEREGPLIGEAMVHFDPGRCSSTVRSRGRGGRARAAGS
ncbi:hypothetical protein [Actinoplanes sp. L3-i22]|uniref:hypothetical protein n=1 Tax=Actinoplanes sp. L3-i22 TaxID=2836373 RepID=UPI001C76F178|nr:hypothetical protein [Actinoplanes sp. L3-i22]BCY12088.1 hypothetical protein L3i22_071760 [Actinoplanes sp. L3-i22]